MQQDGRLRNAVRNVRGLGGGGGEPVEASGEGGEGERDLLDVGLAEVAINICRHAP
jgi:hypothetical protein